MMSQKGHLGDIDIPTEHLALKTRPTRRVAVDPYIKKNSQKLTVLNIEMLNSNKNCMILIETPAE